MWGEQNPATKSATSKIRSSTASGRGFSRSASRNAYISARAMPRSLNCRNRSTISPKGRSDQIAVSSLLCQSDLMAAFPIAPSSAPARSGRGWPKPPWGEVAYPSFLGPLISLHPLALCHLHPFLLPGRLQDGITDILRPQRIAEVRHGRLAFRHPVKEIGHLVDETVLIPDLQPRHPPFPHVGMVAVGDMDRTPAAHNALVAVVEVLQPVQVVQVPEDRGMFAVDFERVQRFVAAGVAGRFERRQGAIT